jgi:hypothetical protein
MLGCLLTIRSADGFINELVLQPVDVSALPASERVRFTDLGDQGWSISAVATPPPPQTSGPPLQADLLDAEVRGLLDLLGAKPVIIMANYDFADRRFFAVSALGRAPSPGGLSLKGHGIAPYRVLDPLRWVMHGRGWL